MARKQNSGSGILGLIILGFLAWLDYRKINKKYEIPQSPPPSPPPRQKNQQHEDIKKTPLPNLPHEKAINLVELRKLYRNLLIKHHPDFAKSDEDRKFREKLTVKINSAYQAEDIETLIDVHIHKRF